MDSRRSPLRRHRAGLVLGVLALPALAVPAAAQTFAAPAPAQAAPVQVQAAPLPGAGSYSPNLGIYYQLVPYGAGYAARLTQPPLAGSPLSQAQIQLEAGDTITALDDMALVGPQSLESHYAQTKVTFINVRTNQLEARYATLAGAAPPPNPGPFPPQPPQPPSGMSLGVFGVPTTLYVQGASAYAAPAPGTVAAAPVGTPTQGLRITQVTPGSPAQYAGLTPGDTILTAGAYSTADVNALRYAIQTSNGVLPMTVANAYGQVRNAVATLGGAGAAYAAPAAP